MSDSRNNEIKPILSNEARFHALLQNQHDLVYCFLPDTTLTFANQSYCEYLNLALEDILHQKLTDILPSSQSRKLLSNIRQLQDSPKKIHYEYKTIRGDGKPYWFSWTFSPLSYRGPGRHEYQAVGRDISAQKEALEQIKGQHKKLKAILDSQPAAVFLLDRDHEILFHNALATRWLEIIKQNSIKIYPRQNLKEFIYPEDLYFFVSDVDQAFKGKNITREKQLPVREDELQWFEWNYSPVIDERQNIIATLLSIRDISSSKKAELSLREQRIQTESPESMSTWLELVKNNFLPYLQSLDENQNSIQALELDKLKINTNTIPTQVLQKIFYHGIRSLGKDLNRQSNSTLQIELDTVLEPPLDPGEPQKMALVPEWARQFPGVGFMMLDHDATIQFAGGQLLTRFGLGDEWGVGQSVFQLLDEETARVVRGAIQREEANQAFSYLFSQDQASYMLYLSQIPRKGEAKNWHWLMLIELPEIFPSDVSGEDNPGVSPRYLDPLPLPVFMLSEDGQIIYVNPAFLQLSGYLESAILSVTFWELLENRELDLKSRDAKDQTQIFDTQLRRSDLSFLPVRIKILQIAPYRHLGVLEDISHWKTQELQLLEAVDQAERRAQAQAQFLSTMSHEIRTPLNAVIALSHYLLEEDPKPDQVRSLKTLRFSAENLLSLINDILDYNKIESGMVQFETIDFDPRSLLQSIKESMEYRAREKKLPIILDYDDHIPQVIQGDPVRLSQILTNLIDNAIKFTSDGYVKVSARLQNLGEEEVEIRFAVSDTGIGIPLERQEVIFERFTQATKETTRKFGGTGLGLAITKKLLELMGSQVQLQSIPNQGSRFSFKVSFLPGHNAQIEQPDIYLERSPQFNLMGAKILVVEDNEINQLVTRQFLNKWNAHVDNAENGEIAVALVSKKSYDLVLMDLEMPVLDGYQATEQITSLPGLAAKVPIIALTADTSPEVEARSRQAGMVELLTKPFTPNELYQVIRKYLDMNQKPEGFEGKDAPGTDSSKPNKINFKRIIEISGGNKTFIRRFNELTEKAFLDFAQNFEEIITARDYESLRKLNHSIKATIDLLGLHELQYEIQAAKRLLQEDPSPITELEQSIRNIHRLCEEYRRYLKEYFYR